MSGKSHLSLGPGAPSLILIFVVLSLTALGMLSLMTSRNDLRLSERSAQVIEAVYALNERAEERRAAIDAAIGAAQADEAAEDWLAAVEAYLPEDVALEEDLLCWTETDGVRTLECALRLQMPGGAHRTRWVRHDLTTGTGTGTEEDWN